MSKTNALLAGVAGSITLTAIHEGARRVISHAPRVDVIGMRGIERPIQAAGEQPPPRKTLYWLAIGGDLVSNALYYSLVGGAADKDVMQRASVLGLLAGLGAATLPQPLGLGKQPGSRFPITHLMTIAWYLAGGLMAGLAYRKLSDL